VNTRSESPERAASSLAAASLRVGEVEVAPREPDDLGLPHAGRERELDEQRVGGQRHGGRRGHLVGRERASLDLGLGGRALDPVERGDRVRAGWPRWRAAWR
jgi:hypothetical protein